MSATAASAPAQPAPAIACQMEDNCANPVTHLDQNGFVFCTRHGLERRSYRPCRKLRPHEVNRLMRGEQIAKY